MKNRTGYLLCHGLPGHKDHHGKHHCKDIPDYVNPCNRTRLTEKIQQCHMKVPTRADGQGSAHQAQPHKAEQGKLLPPRRSNVEKVSAHKDNGDGYDLNTQHNFADTFHSSK